MQASSEKTSRSTGAVIYPLQLIIVALAVGTGVGLNTYMAREYAHEKKEAADAAVTVLRLSLLRQIVCLLPLFWLLAKLGLGYTWLAFPLAEIISSGVGLILYFHVLKKWKAL